MDSVEIEYNPNGPLELKQVQEVFVRTGKIFALTVDGRVIKTTGEHLFWIVDINEWVHASELKPGNKFLTPDGKWATVEEVKDTGEFATVYNVSVVDYHTYFIGSAEWGWSVWAHNAYTNDQVSRLGPPEFVDPNFVGPPRFAKCRVQDLPKAVRNRLQEIESGNPKIFHPKHDQAQYDNKLYGTAPRPLLPEGGRYVEYYVTGNKGDPRRIIVDQNSGMAYFSPDHHKTFTAIEMPWTR